MKVKKIVALTMAAVVAFGVAGCSCSKTDTSSNTTNSTKSSSSTDYNPLDYVTLGQYEGVAVELNKADYEVTDENLYSKMQELCGL
ncbi:MAG: hypothetical protein K5644_00795, partial [Lachnospiraceae bacterium]|nr:hypothetical protein [Lachnospiraceae bacterium]